MSLSVKFCITQGRYFTHIWTSSALSMPVAVWSWRNYRYIKLIRYILFHSDLTLPRWRIWKLTVYIFGDLHCFPIKTWIIKCSLESTLVSWNIMLWLSNMLHYSDLSPFCAEIYWGRNTLMNWKKSCHRLYS